MAASSATLRRGCDGGGTLGAGTSSTEALMLRLQRLVEGKYKVERMLGKGGMGAVFWRTT